MRSRPIALEIAGGDFDRALDDASMSVDMLFEHAEPLGYFGDRFRFAVSLSASRSTDRLSSDDCDFLAQVIGHFLDGIGLQRVELLEKPE